MHDLAYYFNPHYSFYAIFFLYMSLLFVIFLFKIVEWFYLVSYWGKNSLVQNAQTYSKVLKLVAIITLILVGRFSVFMCAFFVSEGYC